MGGWGRAATGAPLPSYQWFRNGKRVRDATGHELVIASLGEDTVGEYSVDVFNDLGTVNSSIARVKLEAQPPVFVQQPKDVVAALGDTVVLTVKGECCALLGPPPAAPFLASTGHPSLPRSHPHTDPSL